MVIKERIKRAKDDLEKEWYQLLDDTSDQIDEVYEQLYREGKRPRNMLDGPKPEGVKLIEKEYKRKFDDIARRYRELEQQEKELEEK